MKKKAPGHEGKRIERRAARKRLSGMYSWLIGMVAAMMIFLILYSVVSTQGISPTQPAPVQQGSMSAAASPSNFKLIFPCNENQPITLTSCLLSADSFAKSCTDSLVNISSVELPGAFVALNITPEPSGSCGIGVLVEKLVGNTPTPTYSRSCVIPPTAGLANGGFDVNGAGFGTDAYSQYCQPQ